VVKTHQLPLPPMAEIRAMSAAEFTLFWRAFAMAFPHNCDTGDIEAAITIRKGGWTIAPPSVGSPDVFPTVQGIPAFWALRWSSPRTPCHDAHLSTALAIVHTTTFASAVSLVIDQ
jgi:hypothetical protein